MTLDGVTDALQCSRQKMWRIETGIGPTRGLDVKALCDLYAATPELTNALTALANETTAKGEGAVGRGATATSVASGTSPSTRSAV